MPNELLHTDDDADDDDKLVNQNFFRLRLDNNMESKLKMMDSFGQTRNL